MIKPEIFPIRKNTEEGILAREAESTTAVGEGIAIPHAKSSAVKRPGLAAMTVPEWHRVRRSRREAVATCSFMIAAPEDGDLHLEVLSRLMTSPDGSGSSENTSVRHRLPMNFCRRSMRQRMRNSEQRHLTAAEPQEQHRMHRQQLQQAQPERRMTGRKMQRCRIVAVTACPTGIAHTYMAAEALEQKAKELGVSIKVETNGSGGAKNVLTPQEIQEADGVIVAADKNVEMVRFDGQTRY